VLSGDAMRAANRSFAHRHHCEASGVLARPANRVCLFGNACHAQLVPHRLEPCASPPFAAAVAVKYPRASSPGVNLYWPRNRLFRSKARSDRRRLARWRKAEEKGTKAVVVSHAHCLDGVTAAVITQRALGEGVGVAYVQPNDMAEVLQHYTAYPGKGRRLLIADLSLQRDQFDAIVAACRRLRKAGWSVEWRDHHHKQWEGLDLQRLRKEGVTLEVNADATESGASLQQKALAPNDEYLRRLAEVVRDRDLWWNKDPDSETLEFALTQMGAWDFAIHYLTASGPVVDETIRAAAQKERDMQAKVLKRLLSQARYHGEDPTRVGVIYGWLPKNTGLHELLNDHGCRIAINVRPNGKVSLRSVKGADVCHKVAQQFSGGGHPNASGADLGLKGFAFWWYVLRRGKVPRVEAMAQAAVKELQA
jgi:oligoribonuclease NrnB/cAMP/cGMP phosphodiesterase (DHH superfamily)